MGLSGYRSGGRWGLAVSLGVVLVLSSCGADAESETAGGKTSEGKAAEGTEAKSAGGTAVAIANFVFSPQDVEVPTGTKVTWTNEDDAPHNVQDLSELNTPISKDLNKGDRFSITYPKPGTYPYVCGLHTYMTGNVKVT
jgi:plastocyanin